MTRLGTPFDATVTAAPPFGAGEPQMFQPFNLGGRGGTAMQIFAPMIMQQMMSTRGMVPSQFVPTQNFYDQLTAQTYYNQQQLAMRAGAARDVQSIRQTVLGIHTFRTGQAPGIGAQIQAGRMAGQIQGALPILSMIMGPEFADALMGPRGSTTVMAQQMQRGMRFARDPFTGAAGVSGRAAGMIAAESFEQLYGAGVPIGEMRGIGAGQAGAMYHELAVRGLAGPVLGTTPEARMRAVAATQFGEGTMRRVAENRLRSMGRDVTVENIEAVTQEIFGGRDAATGQRLTAPETTLGRIRGAVNADQIDVRALEQLGGSQELMTAGAAQRIGSRLKNLSGAVAAMRDIFGDMGRTGTMREIINGLDALTQGGLATMAPGQVQRHVRLIRNLGQRSGLGVQGILGMQAQAANLADQLGLDRSLAVQASESAAAFAIAAQQTQRFDIPGFGRRTPEQLALMANQLNTQAAGAQITNMLGATVRMAAEGLVGGDTDAARLARAVREGERTSWTDKAGRVRSMQMTNAQWIQMMQASNADTVAAQAILEDQFTTQQYVRDYDIANRITRNMQAEVDIAPKLRGPVANVIRSQMTRRGITDILRQQGIVTDDRGLRRIQDRMGQQLAEAALRAPADVINAQDPQRMNQYLAKQVEDRLAQEVRAAGGNEAAVQAVLESLGPRNEQGVRQGAMTMAAAAKAKMGSQFLYQRGLTGYGNLGTAWGLHNQVTLTQQQAVTAEEQTRGRMQDEFARLGRTGPIQRLVGAVQRAKPGTEFADLMMQAFGGIPREDIARLEQGPVGAMLAAHRRFLNTERYTEAQARQEAMDVEAARAAGMDLQAYRDKQQREIGADWRDKAQDYQQLRQNVEQDADLRSRIDAATTARAGLLTTRGVAQRKFYTRVASAMVTGGAEAERMLAEVARQELGEGGVPGGLTDEYFKSRMQDARSDQERRRLEDFQRVVGGLRLAQQGETAGISLQKSGITPTAAARSRDVWGWFGDQWKRMTGEGIEAAPAEAAPGGPADVQRRMGDASGIKREIDESKRGGRVPEFKLSGRVRIENPDALMIEGDVATGDHENNDVNTGLLGFLRPSF
jgi:hypothetical protein